MDDQDDFEVEDLDFLTGPRAPVPAPGPAVAEPPPQIEPGGAVTTGPSETQGEDAASELHPSDDAAPAVTLARQVVAAREVLAELQHEHLWACVAAGSDAEEGIDRAALEELESLARHLKGRDLADLVRREGARRNRLRADLAQLPELRRVRDNLAVLVHVAQARLDDLAATAEAKSAAQEKLASYQRRFGAGA